MKLFCTDYHQTWNEIKQFLSTCTSMLKFTKLLGRDTPGLPTSTCMLYFSESMLCLKLYTDIFLYMNLYLSTCVDKWAGMRTLVCEDIRHNFAFSPIHGLSHSSLFFCQYYFSFASLHFLNVSRMGSHHIQHLGLGGDSLVKIVSHWETHGSGFCLNWFSVNRQQILSFYS